ncbi:hypothetical protein [Maribacter sp. HTCC2170]|uniref:hypothetical protein n=1 Tax=Maribacter sp. (strain HTCC2170 / KCCM 42371) TaxID=313603 RepID=UPI00006BD4BC|nr:hypothetical protein [Maribacter sp. HTCC2170]EAR03014.1 hypothetical protein FB2170_06985 [Maribacter sp. HTCC2170]
MNKLDFNNKTFSLITNSKNGEVDTETVFEYSQKGNLVTAEYHGGNIRYGKIISVLKSNELHMRYQCITTDDELKAGKAIAEISLNEQGKIKLKLNWEWLGGNQTIGTSEYIEN